MVLETILIIGLLILCLFLFLYLLKSSRNYQKQLDKAAEINRQGNLPKAEKKYRKVIQRLSRRKQLNAEETRYLGQAHLQLGNILRQDDEITAAMEEYSKAEKYIKLDDAVLSFMAIEYAKKKDESEKAQEKYLQLIELRSASSPSKHEQIVYDFVQSLCSISWKEPDPRCDEKMSLCEKVIAVDSKLDWSHINLGKGSFQKENLQDAIAHFKTALEIAESVEAQHLLAFVTSRLHRNEGKLQPAIEQMRKAVRFDPSHPEAHFELGQMLMASYEKRTEDADISVQTQKACELLEAISSFERATECEPQNPDYFYPLGVAHAENHAHERAKYAFQRALELDPGRKETHYLMAKELKSLGQLEAAEAAVQKAISLDDSYSDAYYLKGEIQFALGEYRKAKISFAKSDTGKETSIEVSVRLARANLALGEFKAAIKRLEPYASKSRDAMFYLARSYAQFGQHQDAIEHLEALRKTGEFDWEVLYYLGCSYTHLKQYDEALKAFDAAIRWDKYREETYLQRGNVKMRLNDRMRARHDYETALGISPGWAEAHYAMGVWWHEGDTDEYTDKAISEFKAALKAKKEYGLPHLALATIYEEKGDLEKAINSYRQAIESGLDTQEINAQLGVLYSRMDKHSEAITHLQRAYQLGDPGRNVLYHMGYSLAKQEKYEESIPYWEAVLQDDANAEILLRDLANIRYLAAKQQELGGNLREAVAHWEEYLKVYGSDEKTQRKVAQLLGTLGGRELQNKRQADLATAKADIEKAIEKDSDTWVYKYYLSLCHYLEGQHDRCLSLLNELDNAGLNNGKVKLLKGLTLIETKQWQQGVSELEALKAKNSNLKEPLGRALAAAYMRSGDWNQAADALLPLITD